MGELWGGDWMATRMKWQKNNPALRRGLYVSVDEPLSRRCCP